MDRLGNPFIARERLSPGRVVLTYVAVAMVFSTGFVFRTPSFNFYAYYALLPVVLPAAFLLSGGHISLALIGALLLLLAHALLAVAAFGGSIGGAVEQFLGIAAMTATFYYVLRLNGFDVFRVFHAYMRLAVAVAAIGLVQLAAFLVDFRPGYRLDWLVPGAFLQVSEAGMIRIQSLLQEPAHFGAVLSPAIFVALLNLTGAQRYFVSRTASGLLLVAALASFSTVTYGAIGLAALLAVLNRGRLGKLPWLAAGLGAAVLLYAWVPDIRLRVDDSIALLMHRTVASANWSSLTLHNNALVALESLRHTWLFGGGLGSHPESFAKFSILYAYPEIPIRYALLNAQDASSLLLRIASELGIAGLAAVVWFVVAYYVRRRPQDQAGAGDLLAHGWVISNAALVFLMVHLMRQGHYFGHGLPLFLLIYLYTGRIHALVRGRVARWGRAGEAARA